MLLAAQGVGDLKFTTGSVAFPLGRVPVRGGVAKTLGDRQLVRLRRKLVSGSSLIVAIERRPVGFVGDRVSLLRPPNRMLHVCVVYLLSANQLPQPLTQFAMPFSQLTMPISQFPVPFSEFLSTHRSDFIRQLGHELDRSSDVRVDHTILVRGWYPC